jgi:hypothetical protein
VSGKTLSRYELGSGEKDYAASDGSEKMVGETGKEGAHMEIQAQSHESITPVTGRM